jgi:hypothetical protein
MPPTHPMNSMLPEIVDVTDVLGFSLVPLSPLPNKTRVATLNSVQSDAAMIHERLWLLPAMTQNPMKVKSPNERMLQRRNALWSKRQLREHSFSSGVLMLGPVLDEWQILLLRVVPK